MPCVEESERDKAWNTSGLCHAAPNTIRAANPCAASCIVARSASGLSIAQSKLIFQKFVQWALVALAFDGDNPIHDGELIAFAPEMALGLISMARRISWRAR